MTFFETIKEYFFPVGHKIYLHQGLVSEKKLLFIRMFLFLFSLGIYIATNIDNGSFYKEFVYLTYWGEVLTMLAFLTLLLDNILYLQGYYENSKHYSSHLSRAAHSFFEIAFSFELAIVLMYWVALNLFQDTDKNSFSYTMNILAHGICLILLWIENIVNYIEFVPRHLIFIIIVAIAYTITNVLVVFCINFEVVYKGLNWTDAYSYIYLLVCVGITFLHFGLGVLIFHKIKRKKIELAQNNRIFQVP